MLEFIKFERGKSGKKYAALLKNKTTGRIKKVQFGDVSYQHYKDQTGLNLWSHKDHNDSERRRRYRARHAKEKDTKFTAGWFAYHYLW